MIRKWLFRNNVTEGGYELIHAGMLGALAAMATIFVLWFSVGFLVTNT